MAHTAGPGAKDRAESRQAGVPRRNKWECPDVLKDVKTGLPCRATHDCDVVFQVFPLDSMDALREAAAQRNKHELDAHGYTHVATTQLGQSTFAQGPSVVRRRGRRRREEELNVI